MVFVLENIAKIESDRELDKDAYEIELSPFIQRSWVKRKGNLASNPKVYSAIDDIHECYSENGIQHGWHRSFDGSVIVMYHGLMNSIYWGNKHKYGKKVTTTLKFGKLGCVISMQDEGEGFDFQRRIKIIQDNYQKGLIPVGDRSTSSNVGRGMIHFHESMANIAYHGNGNLFSIATPLTWK
jgi:hypothetical protein